MININSNSNNTITNNTTNKIKAPGFQSLLTQQLNSCGEQHQFHQMQPQTQHLQQTLAASSQVPSHTLFQPDEATFDKGQISSNDPFGATALSSLALVLDGHLKLLDDDDMGMMHNMGEYEDLLSYISSPTPQ
ncbi:hypothetical protein BGZ74_001393 [Mortierella antarctica]|nr:hypothetical protein BGZ74_001393 [Mortierella antarctica]